MTFIDAETISQLQDPDLRYALRLADASAAVGWTDNSQDMKSCHEVTVTAEVNGTESRLIDVTYTGISKGHHDSFMENLWSQAP
jgi:hypothetical protein